jgi:Zn-dependent peptidase ImmA (M78 family)
MTPIIQTLRDGVPIRPLGFAESLRVAELQASKFLALAELTAPPFPEKVIATLPRVQVERMTPAIAAGATHWSRGRWLIVVNGAHPLGKQRFSIAHELKHILDNPFIDVLYPAKGDMTSAERAEQVCDYFAACLLMPRLWVKRAWTSGAYTSTKNLAQAFEVSQAAMRVRLQQIGLVTGDLRCEGVRIAA